MALKYRIVYGDSTRYRQQHTGKNIIKIWLPLLLCTALILFLVFSPDAAKIYELLLPGDPTVTANAFQQLSDAVSAGEALSDALDVFCHAIMDVR